MDSAWIAYNKPKSPELANEYAGFLMALGLNGHLTKLATLNIHDYLTKVQNPKTQFSSQHSLHLVWMIIVNFFSPCHNALYFILHQIIVSNFSTCIIHLSNYNLSKDGTICPHLTWTHAVTHIVFYMTVNGVCKLYESETVSQTETWSSENLELSWIVHLFMWEQQQDGAYHTLFLPNYKRPECGNVFQNGVTTLRHWNEDRLVVQFNVTKYWIIIIAISYLFAIYLQFRSKAVGIN